MEQEPSSKRFEMHSQGFDEANIRAALIKNFERLKASEFRPSPTNSECYRLQDAFAILDQYWFKKAWAERFDDSLTSGILYRPAIVSELLGKVENVLQDEIGKGIMIKGPQGIGKSHSIVNLVRKLLYGSGGKYFVTFIPDCRRWEDVEDLYNAICQSLGSTVEELNIQISGQDSLDRSRLKIFIKIIDKVLLQQGRQWVFIFDQINHIFSRPNHLNADTITQLSFPFPFMENVIDSHRITTIISASVNNELSYKDRHNGFIEYNHRFFYSKQEVSLLYKSNSSYNKETKDRVMAKTSGVPLQVHTLISKHSAPNCNLDFENYEIEAKLSITDALDKLKEKSVHFETISDHACCCVLSLKVKRSNSYDRNYSFYESGKIKPIFPLVLDAYQEFFWGELMKYVETKESEILDVCNNPSVTTYVKKRLFQLLVVRRCQGRSLHLDQNDSDIAHFPGLLSCNLVKRFTGQSLPSLTDDGLYVSVNSNFPAVDLIWKMQGNVWFVKVHVTTHQDVSPSLKEVIESAREEGKMVQGNLFLLYLSPRQEISASPALEHGLSKTINGLKDNNALAEPLFKIAAKSIDMFTCFEGLRWRNT